MGGMHVYNRLLLHHDNGTSVAKPIGLDQDVGFKFVIQHGMNNGFRP
jgi:hypothetical protein